MMRPRWPVGTGVALVALFAACGGKVAIDHPTAAGGGGTGGVIIAGPQPDTSIVSSSVGPTTSVVSVTTAVSVTSTGTGGGAGCVEAPDCFQCCVDQNVDAYAQFVAIVLKYCACGDFQKKCFMPCSDPNTNACGDPQLLDQDCADCINDELSAGDPCGPEAQNACFGDPFCATVLDCFSFCQ